MRASKTMSRMFLTIVLAASCYAGAATSEGLFGKKQLGDLLSGKSVTQVLSGAAGAYAGVVLGDKLAESDAKRLNLSPEEQKERQRGYAIALGLAGFAVGSALGGSVYEKLSEEGRKARERALVEAATQAQLQRYSEPTAPQIAGVLTPGAVYAVPAGNQECMDVEDRLADGASSDAIFVKMCRALPNGAWQQSTA